MHINHLTRHAYAGTNQDTLAEVQQANGYQSREWLTFVQARRINRTVRQGEHGVKLVKVSEERDEKTNATKRSIKRFVVFNLEQTEPLPVSVI
jgi:antirestriction protein ArdC